MKKSKIFRGNFIKQLCDIIIAFIFLLILLPFLLMISIFSYIFIGDPIIFKQERPGLNNKVFKVYKFRTMKNELDKTGELKKDSERLTSYGMFLRKLSLDELPQLWNVLKGDMSFVGPRPLLVEYLPLYSEQQKKRHNVRPGITGLAQVNGRNAISWEEKFELDVWYVENQSFCLDMKILLLTVKKVFVSEGISQEGQATMKKFEGTKSK